MWSGDSLKVALFFIFVHDGEMVVSSPNSFGVFEANFKQPWEFDTWYILEVIRINELQDKPKGKDNFSNSIIYISKIYRAPRFIFMYVEYT